MMKQNMSKSMTTFTIFMLISLIAPLNSALKLCQPKTELEMHKLELAARDAIALSIQEVRETRKFISSIPRLKSFGLTRPNPKLMLCVEHLISDLSDIKITLYRLRHLKPTFLRSDIKSLTKMMGRNVMLGKMCSKSFKNNVDEIVQLLLTRKLGDLALILDDVVYRVSEIEREEYGCETVEKP